jgi:hypothetical protein
MDATKKTLCIDAALLAAARTVCGAVTDTVTVHTALQALIQHHAYQEMRKLLGTERGPVVDVPRRRKPRSRLGPR